MKRYSVLKGLAGVLFAGSIFGLAMPTAVGAEAKVVQRRGGGGGHAFGGSGHAFGGGGGHAFGGGGFHARRESVRTPNFVQRSPSQGFQRAPAPSVYHSSGSRPQTFQGGSSSFNRGNGYRFGVDGTPDRVRERGFTKSHGERRYDNGLDLRAGIRVTAGWQRRYFPSGYCHFPFYASAYLAGSVFISPFGFYFGVCDPFIEASACIYGPPPAMYVDVPIYSGSNCEGFEPDRAPNLLDSPNLNVTEPGLVNAMDELTEAFQNADIDALATLVSPSVSIAIYEQGRYKYSLSPDNFMDLARDAIKNTHTVGFDITTLRQRSPNVFCVSGKQTYEDRNGHTRAVYFSYVLQDYNGQWTLCQVETDPDHIQNF